MPSVPSRFVSVLFALLVVSLLLSCGLRGQPTGSQPIPTSVPSAASIGVTATSTSVAPVPTSAAPTTGVPTQQPTVIAQATPAQPVIDFQPRAGTADSEITVHGWGFGKNSRVVLRIGLPNAVGEVLSSAQTNGTGEWTAKLIIPGVLPSGERITTSTMRIVAMNEENQALANAPFAFTPAPAPIESKPVYGFATNGEEAVRFLLDALINYPDGQEALAYLTPDLAAHYSNRPTSDLLQLQQPFGGYTIDGIVGADGQSLIFQATLDNGEHKRLATTVSNNDAPWVVSGVIALPSDPNAPYSHTAENLAAAERTLRAYNEARAADRAGEAWALQTPALRQVITQESLATSGAELVSSDVTAVAVTASTFDTITFRVTLNLVLESNASDSLGGGLRDFAITMRGVPGAGWLVDDVVGL